MKRFARIMIAGAGFALASALSHAAVQTQLTAEVMDYDVETGDFKAQGNVTLKREGLTLVSVYGTANTQTQKARVWSNVHAFGTYQGEKLDAVCAQLDADFSVDGGDYLMSGGVVAEFGPRLLKSDTARLTGRAFSADKVRHFEDKSRNMVLQCDTLTGDYDDDGLRVADGKGNVHVTQHDDKKRSQLWCRSFNYDRGRDRLIGTGNAKLVVVENNDPKKKTDINCDMLIYSFKAGSVTATGNARAVQNERRINAKTLVYYPNTGKLEAKGKPTITVDITSGKSKGTPSRQPVKGVTPRRLPAPGRRNTGRSGK